MGERKMMYVITMIKDFSKINEYCTDCSLFTQKYLIRSAH